MWCEVVEIFRDKENYYNGRIAEKATIPGDTRRFLRPPEGCLTRPEATSKAVLRLIEAQGRVSEGPLGLSKR